MSPVKKTMQPALALALVLLACTVPKESLAGGDSPRQLHVSREITVAAPSADVWRVISDFCAIQEWHPAVANCEANGGEHPGTLRILTLGNGAQLRELLTIYDADRMTYSYAIAEAQPTTLPVLDYHSSIRVLSEGSSSLIRWEGNFYSQGDDQAAAGALGGVYEGGLAEIKRLVLGR